MHDMCEALCTLRTFVVQKEVLKTRFLVPKPPRELCNLLETTVEFPVNYPPQETNKEILQAQEDLMETIQAFLQEYDHIPPNKKCMALLLAEERFLKIKQAMREEQNQLKDEFAEYFNLSKLESSSLTFVNDDDEYTVIWRRPKAITPDEPSEEPEDPLIIGEEELSTIPEKDKFSVEDLVPIPSGSKGVSDDICDNGRNPSTFDALSNHSEIISDSNNDGTSSDDDSYENIEYVEASPLNLECDSLEEVNEDQEEKEFDLEDIFQIQDVILREKLLNISRLVTNIESLKNNPTPDYVFKSPFSFPISIVDSDSFFEESDTSLSHLDNSLPEFETFSNHTEETRSGKLISIVISDNSNNPLLELPEFESFHFDLDPSFPRPPPEPPDVEISLIIKTDAPMINNFEDECFDPGGDEINVKDDDSFIFVIRTFPPFLTYPEVSPLLLSTRSEDTIFDPGIST
ncbi:hypothetical protein Tco_0020066 [Tanacetum coccineum]